MPEVKTGTEFSHSSHNQSESQHVYQLLGHSKGRGKRKFDILIDYFKLSKYFYAETSSDIMNDYDQVKQVSSLLWQIHLR